MDDIVFKGTYNQYDGWGLAAKDYLKALTYTGRTIRAEPVILSNMVDGDKLGWIEEIEGVKLESSKPIEIHHVLPGSIPPPSTPRRGVWLGYTETSNLQHTGWINYLNLYDQCWTATANEALNLKQSGLEVPVHHVPMPMDWSSVEEDGRGGIRYDYLKDRFNFYFIGELNQRKNLHHLLLAYFREFSYKDPVRLVVKIGPNQGQAFQTMLKHIKGAYRLYKKEGEYPELTVLDHHLPYSNLLVLHRAMDCFVMPSCGESTCRPLLTALFLEKQVICTNGISAKERWMHLHGVQSMEMPCYTITPPLPNIYTGWETWRQIDVIDLQKVMRAVYNKSVWHDSHKSEIIKRHSYESVASIINNLLS